MKSIHEINAEIVRIENQLDAIPLHTTDALDAYRLKSLSGGLLALLWATADADHDLPSPSSQG